jgi:hypothetical protein
MNYRATAWAPRSSTCDKQQAVSRTTAWVPRSSICDKQRAAPRATAGHHDGAVGNGRAQRSSTCVAQQAAAPRAPALKYLRGAAGNVLVTRFKYLHCAAGIGLGTTISSTCAVPRASVWAPRPSICDAQRAVSRATAWAPRPSTCDAQRAEPRVTAWTPQSSTCYAQRDNGLSTTAKYLKCTTRQRRAARPHRINEFTTRPLAANTCPALY